MSRSYTSRPAVTQARGRGRGAQTQTRQPGMYGNGARPRVGPQATPGLRSQPGDTEEAGGGEDTGQQMSYEGGYTKITPNMKKRQQINEVAAREREAYELHRQQHTQKSFSYVGTAGGGQLTEMEARQRAIQASPNKAQKLLQNQARKSFMKQKEEEELQRMKEEQRQKSLQNEQRKKDKEQAMASRWDDQRKRTNDAFLNRIEARNKKALADTGQNASSRAPQQPVPPHLQRRQPPEGAGAASKETVASREVTREDEHSPDMGGDLTSEQRKAVVAVSAVFPDFTREELVELLTQVDFSVDSAILLLSE